MSETHSCPVPGCTNILRLRSIFCDPHWLGLTPELRGEIRQSARDAQRDKPGAPERYRQVVADTVRDIQEAG